MTPAQVGDYESGVVFARKIFMEYKQKNKDEGINGAQAIWLHHRVRAWQVNFRGIPYTVDLINMAASGDLETACLSLMYGQPDDMTQPYHWFTQERIDCLVTEIKGFLGWA
jgi:hypothetical protein